MTDRLALPRRYRDQLEALLREHVPGVEVWAYGSRVNGESHDGSDLDLALRGPALEPLDGGYYDLLEAIEKSSIPILVQTHDWAMLPESFHREIERDYIVVQQGAKQATGGWQEASLGEVIELKRGYDLPQRKRIPGSVPLVSSSGVTYYHTEAKVRGPGVVTGRYGTLGEVFFVPSDFWPLNTTLYVRDFKGNDPRFISYFLRGLDFSAYSDKAAVPGLNRNHLHQAAVRYPADITEQQAIAHILGTLDDKIELNQRMNETLEAMARALFKSWFVDFEPVRAKMEGRWRRGESLPGLPAEHYDLFPDLLVDSELGEVPEGWEVKALGECFNLTMGQSPPGSTYNDNRDGLPFFQGRTDFGFRYPENRKFCTSPIRIAQPGDTLVSVRAPVGDINMAWERCCLGRGVAALRHKSGSISFTYYSVEALQPEIGQYEHTGTVFGAINKDQFAALRTMDPSATLVDQFRTRVQPLDERIKTNTAESRSLIAQRDALLLILVSGEVRVEGNTA